MSAAGPQTSRRVASGGCRAFVMPVARRLGRAGDPAPRAARSRGGWSQGTARMVLIAWARHPLPRAGNATAPALALDGLCKVFGQKIAVNMLSLAVPPGSILMSGWVLHDDLGYVSTAQWMLLSRGARSRRPPGARGRGRPVAAARPGGDRRARAAGRRRARRPDGRRRLAVGLGAPGRWSALGRGPGPLPPSPISAKDDKALAAVLRFWGRSASLRSPAEGPLGPRSSHRRRGTTHAARHPGHRRGHR